jgi:hypothetical protein
MKEAAMALPYHATARHHAASPARRAGPSSRAYSAAHFLLELDQHENVGFIRSLEGGGVRSETLAYRGGDSHAIYRQQGAPHHEELRIQIGMSMSRSFCAWIEGFVSGRGVRKSGAIVAGDFHYKERARRTFRDAIIGAVTLPRFDGADRSPCYMGVTLLPERVELASGTAADLPRHIGARQKLWSPNRFDFAIDGFESATRRTMKVDSFTIKQEVHEYRSGDLKDPIRVPGRVELPNLFFYVPEADASPLFTHFTRTVVEGRRTDGRLTGHLSARDSDGNALCTVDLHGVEIASIGPDRSDAGSQEIKQVRVEIAVEAMKLNHAASGIDG